MNVKSGVTFHNKFDWELTNGDTGEIKQKGTAYNIVLDRYYRALPTNDRLRLTGISVGTGTGTPATTDTGLFSFLDRTGGALSGVTELAPHQYSMTLTVVFTENQANGLLTEVGIGASGEDRIMTHAMLTDAEGHTITVEKTNTDRLTITATMYLTVQYPQSVLPNELPLGVKRLGCHVPAATSKQLSSCPWIIQRAFGNLDSLDAGQLGICAAKHTPLTINLFSTSISYFTDGFRKTGSRILSTDWNKEFTYQIYGITTDIGVIPLPNHNVFPPVELELEAVGDGTTTGFNFGIPELTADIQVWIDGVLQPANSYVWNRKDFTLRQAWISQHGEYLINQPYIIDAYRDYFASPIICWEDKDKSMSNDYPKEFVYDFGSPYTVNTLTSTSGDFDLYYSSDNTNWTLAGRVTSSGYGTTATVTISPISARYWKSVWNSIYFLPEGTDWNAGSFLGAFDNVTNQLEFNSAPANGAVIKIKSKTEYPIKNSNWIIDQVVVDTTITKGSAL